MRGTSGNSCVPSTCEWEARICSTSVDPERGAWRITNLEQSGGWYDLLVTVAGDATFTYRLAGHVETGKDSISDPALGGVVPLKA